MQCFICVIYLVISCKGLPHQDREISSSGNNISISTNDNIEAIPESNENVEISELVDPHPNRTQIKLSENRLENDEKIKPHEEFNLTTVKPMSASTEESIFSGINKEYIKYMITGAKGSDQLFRPILNEMEDMSQIGDTDRLTIINPTVIVNFRGTIWNKDSDIKLGQKKKDKRKPENIFV